MNPFKKLFAWLRLQEAIRKADNAWKQTNKRHYVLPGTGRSLLIMDRKNFRLLKRKGYIPNKASTRDADLESFYFTPHADGSNALSDYDKKLKVEQYYRWFGV